MAEINPPWRTDPLLNIINVNWGGYRIVLNIMYMAAAPQWKLEFNTPKAYFSPSEIDSETNPVIPQWGAPSDIPTDTRSQDQEFGPPTLRHIIQGGARSVSGFQESIDWRGYKTVKFFSLVKSQPDPNIEFQWIDASTPAGTWFYNYKGKRINSIPKDNVNPKGLKIASDDLGVVRMSYSEGLAKYDPDGARLWKIDRVPDTASFNKDTGLLVAPDGETINHYDLNGKLIRSHDLGDDISAVDVSRKGKVYAFRFPGSSPPLQNYPDILGYDIDGKLLFTIPADGRNFGQPFFSNVVALGEKYIVVTTQALEVFSEIRPEANSSTDVALYAEGHTTWSMRIYNANTGQKVSERSFGRSANNSYSYPLDGVTLFQLRRITAFNQLSMRRNAYFPS